jgi:hypothetical protein
VLGGPILTGLAVQGKRERLISEKREDYILMSDQDSPVELVLADLALNRAGSALEIFTTGQ